MVESNELEKTTNNVDENSIESTIDRSSDKKIRLRKYKTIKKFKMTADNNEASNHLNNKEVTHTSPVDTSNHKKGNFSNAYREWNDSTPANNNLKSLSASDKEEANSYTVEIIDDHAHANRTVGTKSDENELQFSSANAKENTKTEIIKSNNHHTNEDKEYTTASDKSTDDEDKNIDTIVTNNNDALKENKFSPALVRNKLKSNIADDKAVANTETIDTNNNHESHEHEISTASVKTTIANEMEVANTNFVLNNDDYKSDGSKFSTSKAKYEIKLSIANDKKDAKIDTNYYHEYDEDDFGSESDENELKSLSAYDEDTNADTDAGENDNGAISINTDYAYKDRKLTTVSVKDELKYSIGDTNEAVKTDTDTNYNYVYDEHELSTQTDNILKSSIGGNMDEAKTRTMATNHDYEYDEHEFSTVSDNIMIQSPIGGSMDKAKTDIIDSNYNYEFVEHRFSTRSDKIIVTSSIGDDMDEAKTDTNHNNEYDGHEFSTQSGKIESSNGDGNEDTNTDTMNKNYVYNYDEFGSKQYQNELKSSAADKKVANTVTFVTNEYDQTEFITASVKNELKSLTAGDKYDAKTDAFDINHDSENDEGKFSRESDKTELKSFIADDKKDAKTIDTNYEEESGIASYDIELKYASANEIDDANTDSYAYDEGKFSTSSSINELESLFAKDKEEATTDKKKNYDYTYEEGKGDFNVTEFKEFYKKFKKLAEKLKRCQLNEAEYYELVLLNKLIKEKEDKKL